MLDLWVNTRKLWFAKYIGEQPILDGNGDDTGDTKPLYDNPVEFRANISPSRGSVDEDIFGQNVSYSRTVSTSKLNLGIDEQSVMWDEEPEGISKGTVDYDAAKYRVVAVAMGKFTVHYALKELNNSRDVDNE